MDERGVRVPHNVNPVAKVERYRVPAPQIEFLTAEDIDQQLRVVASDLHLGTMVATLIFAGLRRAELLWLRCTDIDFGAGTHGQIRVQAKSVGGEFWQPKTKMNRVIPISATLKRFLVDHGGTDKSNAWLFPCVGPATFGTVLLDG
jgi:integrase